MRIVRTMGAPQVFWLAVGLVLVGFAAVGQAQHLVIGLDNKLDIDDAGKQVPRPPGKDAVVIVDITNREAPRIVGSLPLMNSLLGPPTNLAVTPNDHVALVANSVGGLLPRRHSHPALSGLPRLGGATGALPRVDSADVPPSGWASPEARALLGHTTASWTFPGPRRQKSFEKFTFQRI